jgi:hypothetical protein
MAIECSCRKERVPIRFCDVVVAVTDTLVPQLLRRPPHQAHQTPHFTHINHRDGYPRAATKAKRLPRETANLKFISSWELGQRVGPKVWTKGSVVVEQPL